ncbi:major facilitator superfamily domain-containing protein [Obelidium mucronatum]|nr:major facilitator superfamily domain-containing protein [Obelidium mucronatum]
MNDDSSTSKPLDDLTSTMIDSLDTEGTSICSSEGQNLLSRGARESLTYDEVEVPEESHVSDQEMLRIGIGKINEQIVAIGMGSYQWRLFVLCGFGWFADNMWLQGVSVVIPALRREFGLSETEMGVGSSFVMLGMMVGSAVWGVLSDVIGRKPAFTLTLLITAVFGFWAASAQNFAQFYWRLFMLGTGVGGNLPIDGSLFLEFVPASHGNLMTLLSLFWPLGQIFTAVIAWRIIPIGSCPADLSLPCDIVGGENWAWRAILRILAVSTAFMVLARVLIVNMLESPKYLLSVGQPEEAERVLKELGKINGYPGEIATLPRRSLSSGSCREQRQLKDVWNGLIDEWNDNIVVGSRLFLSLFEIGTTRQTTVLIFAIWSLISLGYTMFNGFLPIFLGSTPDGESPPISIDETYRNYMILAIMGVPGSFAGMFLIDTRLGRKGTMAASTFGTALFLYVFTFSQTPEFQLFAGSVVSVLQNCMYGVLYTYTPEIFETNVRGTANGAAAALSRVFGCLAPLLTGLLLNISMSVPLFLASAAIFGAGLCMLFLPLETRGRDVL